MSDALRQYARLLAIFMLVMAPAWGINPVFGIIVGYLALFAWAASCPFTAFDVALGNFIIKLWRSALPSPPSQEGTT